MENNEVPEEAKEAEKAEKAEEGEEGDNEEVNSEPEDDKPGSLSDIFRPSAVPAYKSVQFIYIRMPPDGGWAWLVLICSFVSVATLDGILLCIGHLLPVISDELTISVTQSTLISSIQNGVYYMVGPFVSAAMNRFGFRLIGISGAALSAIAMFAGSLAKSYGFLLIFFGVLVGVGFGMVFAASSIIVGYYFEKYRAIATGISCAGSGFGTLVFSPLNQFLIKTVGWRHTLQVHGGFCTIIAFICLVFRPVPAKKVGAVDMALTEESEESIEIASSRYSKFLAVEDLGLRSDHVFSKHKPKKKKSCWQKCCPCCYKKKKKPKKKKKREEEPVQDEEAEEGEQLRQSVLIDVGPLYRDDIFYTGNVEGLREYKDVHHREAPRESINYILSITKIPKPEKRKRRRPLMPRAIRDGFHMLFDVSILKLFKFQVILLASFIFIVGSNIPYLFMTRRAKIDDPFPELLLPVTGVLNIIFRIGSGIVSFKLKKVDPAYLTGGTLVFAGIVGMISSEYGHELIWFQFSYCVAFAIGASFFASLRTVIAVNLLGLAKLTNAFGITSLIMGIGTFLGTTLGGILVDITGNYDAAFQFAGWSFLLSGVINCYIPYIQATSKLRGEEKKVRFSAPN